MLQNYHQTAPFFRLLLELSANHFASIQTTELHKLPILINWVLVASTLYPDRLQRATVRVDYTNRSVD